MSFLDEMPVTLEKRWFYAIQIGFRPSKFLNFDTDFASKCHCRTLELQHALGFYWNHWNHFTPINLKYESDVFEYGQVHNLGVTTG